ncbi:MAG TPA: NAD(P)/FAD-dependent oxidoreductase [Xanthobacteraceae bacterium]|nr:NAD(P)/FAD-dependent oxidoreductase [Xanthobacteraceae bacterium]
MRTPVDRRRLLTGTMAALSAAVASPAVHAQNAGQRVIVVGGGFGGAACARALRKADPRLSVTLITDNATYTASPMSNSVIAGLRELKGQQFGYNALKRSGIDLFIGSALKIDPHNREVGFGQTADLLTARYDRLVLSPGIDFRWNAIQGYDEAASAVIPHAYRGAEQIALLRRQLESMADGGTVVIAAPVNPARCPPAPYERASLIAYYLKTKKPRSKVIVLDAKDSFTMQKLFENAWKALYPGMLEWVSVSSGGAPTSVDAKTRTISTDFDKYEAAVANVIPPQRAGRLAEIAGVADRTGWCPVDPVTFESKLQPGIHVIGDAAIAGAMPRSASAATVQGRICAAAIAALFAGKTPPAPTLTSSCFSLIAPDYAISQRGTYRPVGDLYNESDPGITMSPLDAAPAERSREAKEAAAWFADITAGVFG